MDNYADILGQLLILKDRKNQEKFIINYKLIKWIGVLLLLILIYVLYPRSFQNIITKNYNISSIKVSGRTITNQTITINDDEKIEGILQLIFECKGRLKVLDFGINATGKKSYNLFLKGENGATTLIYIVGKKHIQIFTTYFEKNRWKHKDMYLKLYGKGFDEKHFSDIIND